MSEPADPSEFAAQQQRRIEDLAGDASFQQDSIDWMKKSSHHGYTYNFRWLGLPVIQFPQDLVALQEVIYDTRPDLIIETGVARGGGCVFLASMLALIGGGGRVAGIDIALTDKSRRSIVEHPLADRITLIEGSSIDSAVHEQVNALAAGSSKVMVCLDSDHSHRHVLEELRAFGPLVTRGCYLVVFDTVIEELPAGFLADDRFDKGDSPGSAVRQYLDETDRFEVDHGICGKLAITTARGGYLRCMK